MNQTVLALSASEALQISDQSHILEVRSKTIHNEFQPAFESLLIDNRFYRPLSIFKYGDRVKVSFALRQPYAAHYVLSKGLLEFHRSTDFVFDYNRIDRSFHVSIRIEYLESLRKFLGNISIWLDEELYFRSALKEIIAFEKTYKSKMEEVYALQSTRRFKNTKGETL
jgi:hypothetical protein